MIEVPEGSMDMTLRDWTKLWDDTQKEGRSFIEEEGVPWYYDTMKFFELGVYPNGANKRERH